MDSRRRNRSAMIGNAKGVGSSGFLKTISLAYLSKDGSMNEYFLPVPVGAFTSLDLPFAKFRHASR